MSLKSLLLLTVFSLQFGIASLTGAASSGDLFPEYDVIKPNVAFWTDIYSRYTTRQGVLHDNRRLDRIYGIIDLTDPDQPGGRKINRERTKAAKEHYRDILLRLAEGMPPETSEERMVAGLFGSDATARDYYRARKNIRCQVGQSDRFKEGLVRSGAYLDQIKKIFRQYGLPVELGFLPHVESSFNSQAYSKFGAAGMWQFTRSTGKRYMSIGYAVDERRDPILSTHAAAKLLKRNYERLQNWPMAITAYNHGTSGMMRAKRAKGTYEAIFTSYKTRLFQFASRNFYSEFLAAWQVAENYRQYFGELVLDKPQVSSQVRLKGYVSLPELAGRLELDIDTLHRLNPALRKPVVEGKKYVPRGYRLRLPYADGRDWGSLIARLAPDLYKTGQTRSRFYTVRYGDTAGKIARKYRVRLKDLIAVNNLDARATIYVNQNLSIPMPGEPQPPKKSIAVAKTGPGARGSSAKSAKSAPPAVAIAKSKPAPRLEMQPTLVSPAPHERKIRTDQAPVVLAGVDDKISARPSSTENPPTPTSIKHSPVPDRINHPAAPHEEIRVAAVAVPRPTDTAADLTDSWYRKARQVSMAEPNPEIITGNLAVERVVNSDGRSIGIIYVEVEETLGHYAEWLGIRAQDLRRLNNIRYGKMIRLGQKLKIPLHQVGKDNFEEKRYEFHKELAEDFFAAYRIESLQPYYIKRGDNIWTLSRDSFELPLWLIRRYNADVDMSALMPAQKLMIPVVEKNV